MKYRLTATKQFTVEVEAENEEDAVTEAQAAWRMNYTTHPVDWEIEEIKDVPQTHV